jgi:hypothetical protein
MTTISQHAPASRYTPPAPGTARPGDGAPAAVAHDGALPDALVWFGGTIVIFSLLFIGAVSGDALFHSERYANGTWVLNPNHLLFEPIGAAWHRLLVALGSTREIPDQLILLSVWSGALSLGLFRYGIAGFLKNRTLANYATLWVAFSSAWLRLLISGEHFMLEMPFMVLSALATLRYVRDRQLRDAALAGAFGGVAALFMISNVIIVSFTVGVGLALWHAVRREWRRATAVLFTVGAASAAVMIGALFIAWAIAVPDGIGFIEWTTNYSGGGRSSREALAYGLNASGASLPVAAARALYGAASSLLDLQPVVQVFRDGTAVTARTVIAIASFVVTAAFFAAMLAVLWRHRRDSRTLGVLLLVTAWAIGTLGFAVLWDNSDDQFYFHLAICFALVAAMGAAALTPRWRRLAMAVGAVTILFNAGDVLTRFVLYPRTERIAALKDGLQGAGLIVAPGENDVETMISFTGPETIRRYSTIIVIAGEHEQAEGLAVLEDRIRQALARGERVDLLEMFDTPPNIVPWKTLRRMDWDKAAVLAVLDKFPVEPVSRRLGPYTVRSIHPTPSRTDTASTATANVRR